MRQLIKVKEVQANVRLLTDQGQGCFLGYGNIVTVVALVGGGGAGGRTIFTTVVAVAVRGCDCYFAFI